VLMIIGTSACGSAGSQPPVSSSATSTFSALRAPTRVSFGSGSVGAPDPTTTVPTERGNPIPTGFAAGQNIIITRKGFSPETLEASVSSPIVWTNLSGSPQRIKFVNFPVDSGTIPAGGTFTWSTVNVVALEYQSSSGFRGVLDLNAATG
jgi:hypothetical protein